jgi:hypothetical protein
VSPFPLPFPAAPMLWTPQIWRHSLGSTGFRPLDLRRGLHKALFEGRPAPLHWAFVKQNQAQATRPPPLREDRSWTLWNIEVPKTRGFVSGQVSKKSGVVLNPVYRT